MLSPSKMPTLDALENHSKVHSTIRRLGKIYNGLTLYILAKHGGSQNIPRIKKQDCLKSPITRTFFLLKHEGELHLKSIHNNFPLEMAPLELAWIQEIDNVPQEDPPPI